MTSEIRGKIEKIMQSETLTKVQKIKELEDLHFQSRAAQRAASESSMTAPDSLETDLKHVDMALAALGEEETADAKSAATL